MLLICQNCNTYGVNAVGFVRFPLAFRDILVSIMFSYAEDLFEKLQTADSIKALIGQSEDVHFDCKEWSANDGEAQKIFAKATCGLTNAEGGVLVIGMTARSASKGEPDVVVKPAPVADTNAVKSRLLDWFGQLVEPRIEGGRVVEVNEPAGSKSGFVVVYVPASEGPPRRSRKDGRFYQRIGSGTFPMEYFQIEERFGRRPAPKLMLYLELQGIRSQTYAPRMPARYFVFGLSNVGQSVIKFPSLRYVRASGLSVDSYGIDGCGNFGLPQRPSENAFSVFRGGIDVVIYSEEVRKIGKLWQAGNDARDYGQSSHGWTFAAATLRFEVSCDGATPVIAEERIEEFTTVWP